MAISSSSSSSSSSPTWVYDVFPSFSGEDVRVTFLSHFLKELDRKLIIAFKDNKIRRSRSLDPELKQAIRSSRIAVVVFSKKYASSSWCLNELLEIVKCRNQCGQMVIPIFYGLDPSHVRKQTGEFGNTFQETCHNKTEEEKIQWTRALIDVANTLGYHSVMWDNEAKMIEKIANDVLERLLLTPSKDSEDFVGIEDHIAEMSLLLELEAEEARMVGLWGSSGIGKTTIARVLFQRLSRHFQSRIFIDRAFLSKSMEIYSKANPDDYNMKLHLQRNFLSEILGKKDIKINHLSAVGERLKHQKVLIFIDDFSDQVVLDALVGQTQWFGSGSRIIVVTNDKNLLRAHGIYHIHEVYLPSEKHAVEMLCRSAFRKNCPRKGFEKLVVKVARLAGCLPLALSVLGSSLRGRDNEYWMDLLPRLQNGIDGKVEKILKVSYDGLDSEEDKTIFRYIACYFNGAKVAYMKLLLADSGLRVNVGLENLADKSLIHVREGRVQMHRLLEEMGKNVVRLEKPKNREFLEDSQDICDVLSQGTGSQKIIGITLDIDEIDELYVHKNAFRGMRNLRFLEVYSKLGLYREVKCQLAESFDYLPPKLKLLHWDEYPVRCMPSTFRPETLVKLIMENSKLEKLWEGIVSLTCLTEMNLRGSQNLIEMPDISKATNLETLNLTNCYSLVKLPSSIPHPNKLTTLFMCNCRNLETIPTGISLKSLKNLYLNGCSRLRTFPELITNIVDLQIDKTSIEEFPPYLRFKKIKYFSMTKLKSKKLWEIVQPLTPIMAMLSPSINHMYLSNISTLVELPSSFQNLRNLARLEITNCVNLETIPTGINLPSLYVLDLSGCSRLRTFPGISTNISELNLSETGIEEVPWWTGEFSELQKLEMKGCNKLQYVNLKIFTHMYGPEINFSECKALTGVGWSDSPRRPVLDYSILYSTIDFTNCFNLDRKALFQLKTYSDCQLWLSGEQVPSYFTHRTTGTSSSLSIHLLPSFLSQPFLRFRACLVFHCNNTFGRTSFRFKGRFWNRFNLFAQAQDLRADTEVYKIFSYKKDSNLLILDCCIRLSRDNDVLAEMNYTHVDLHLDIWNRGPSDSEYRIKEWGVQLFYCSTADNLLGHPNIFSEADEGNTLSEIQEGEVEAIM